MQLYLPKVAEGSFSTVKTATASKFITCACLDPLERRNVFSCSLVGVIHTRVSRNALVYTCYRRVMTQETKNTKNKKNPRTNPSSPVPGSSGQPFPDGLSHSRPGSPAARGGFSATRPGRSTGQPRPARRRRRRCAAARAGALSAHGPCAPAGSGGGAPALRTRRGAGGTPVQRDPWGDPFSSGCGGVTLFPAGSSGVTLFLAGAVG